MLFGIRLRNNITGETAWATEAAKSKINAKRLGDRIRKNLRRKGYAHISVEVVRLR